MVWQLRGIYLFKGDGKNNLIPWLKVLIFHLKIAFNFVCLIKNNKNSKIMERIYLYKYSKSIFAFIFKIVQMV